MPVLLRKDMTAWLTGCRGNKIEQVESVVEYLDVNVILEEGFTLENLINFIYDQGIYPSIVEQFGKCPKSDVIDDDYEYISITPKYTLDIKNNGVHIIDKSYNLMNIETIDGSVYIFDYMVTEQVLNLQIQVEREVIEYNDAKFYMPADLTLRELFLTLSDGLIES